MSSDQEARRDLVRRVMSTIRTNADQTDRLDQIAFARLGLNRTDGRAVEILSRLGPMTAKQLAANLGMTTGGVTTVIDRIERAGYVRRRHDHEDRRRVLLETTDLHQRREREIFGQLIANTMQLVSSVEDEELVVIQSFLERIGALVAAHCDELARGKRVRRPRRVPEPGRRR